MSQYVPHSLVSCWTALDDATVENGCLWFIPGSHKWGLIAVEREREIERRALAGALENEVPIELKAGDCSFHHSLLLHCSQANRSTTRRRGYATQYMSSPKRSLQVKALRLEPISSCCAAKNIRAVFRTWFQSWVSR